MIGNQESHEESAQDSSWLIREAQKEIERSRGTDTRFPRESYKERGVS